MDLLLTASFVVHVVAAAVWTGAVLFVAYALFPLAGSGDLAPPAFERTVDGLLRVTRWTGLALPVTGFYQVWRLYPLDALTGSTRGHLVLGMLALWGVLNGLLELGIYRMRTADGESVGVGEYMAEGFVLDGSVDVKARAAVGRPYLLASTALAVLVLVDAALLAAGVSF